jgi:hypothetical protein
VASIADDGAVPSIGLLRRKCTGKIARHRFQRVCFGSRDRIDAETAAAAQAQKKIEVGRDQLAARPVAPGRSFAVETCRAALAERSFAQAARSSDVHEPPLFQSLL